MSTGILFIQAARRLLLRAHAEVDLKHELSMSDTLLMLSVHVSPGTTANELAEKVSRDKTTISRSLARLMSHGLVRDEIDSLDGRRKNLFLTDRGRLSIRAALDCLEDDLEASAQAPGGDVVERIASIADDILSLASDRE